VTTVLHVLNDVDNAGNGIVNAVVDLACEQRRRGDTVYVASAGGGYEPLLAEHGVRHVTVAGIRRPTATAASARHLRRLVLDHSIEIAHAHMNFSTVLARAAVAGTPARCVASAHTAFKWESALMALADRVIALGEAGASTMRRRGVRPSRLRIVRNGTVGSVRNAATGTAELARPAIVTVAGMNPRKGIDVLIRAFEQVAVCRPEAQLHLVGDGPERRTYQAQADATGVAERIRFHGFRDDVGAVLRAADVFVLPSRRDPFPLVILEAREAGCAIVASSVDGIPEASDWGLAAWLVPVDDVAALAAALSTLISDPAVLATWREAARRDLQGFSVARVADEVQDVYDDVLGSRR
jgi:glycosyltransferase involved in cell wall biosynthesis